MPKENLWATCYVDEHRGVSPDQFRNTFCNVCRNPHCTESSAAPSRWHRRMDTQVDRLLDNPQYANPGDPRYEDIRRMDFPNLLQKAMALEIADQRGDWEIPTKEDAMALVGKMMRPTGFQGAPETPPEPVTLWEGHAKGSSGGTYEVALRAQEGKPPAWSCTCPAFVMGKRRGQPCKHIEEAKSLFEAEQEESAPPPTSTEPPRRVSHEQWQQVGRQRLLPRARNTKFPSTGMMVDGSLPEQTPIPEEDPWAIKPKAVPVHGEIIVDIPEED